MTRRSFALFAALLFSSSMSIGDSASAQPVYDVELTQDGWMSSDGAMKWKYTIKNNGTVTIPKGVRFSIHFEIPGRLKTVYFDTQLPAANSISTQRFWRCDPPYGLPHPTHPQHWWGGAANKNAAMIPGSFNCHFVADAPVKKDQELRQLYMITDGGYPASTPLCARASSATRTADDQWLKNDDPKKQGSNRKCFAKPGGTDADLDVYDLKLDNGLVGANSNFQTWQPKIANIGKNPIPLQGHPEVTRVSRTLQNGVILPEEVSNGKASDLQ